MAETNEALAALVASLREGELDFGKPVAETRAYFDAMLAGMPVAEDLTFTPDALAGLPALHTLSPGAATDAALLYLHGGAYISGTPQGYRGLAAELARATGVQGFALDYRLAPEHPFPAAVDDAVAGYEALLARGLAPGRVVLAGDSAGGGLTAATLVALRDKGLPLPAAALMISPWADLTGTSASLVSKACLAIRSRWRQRRGATTRRCGWRSGRRCRTCGTPLHSCCQRGPRRSRMRARS